MKLPSLTDLTSISAESDKVRTHIDLVASDTGTRTEWLRFGLCNLTPISHNESYLIRGPLDPIYRDLTDDVVYGVHFSVIGLKFDLAMSHTTIFSGWIAMDEGDRGFHVPNPGYDPRREADEQKKEKCSSCKKTHFSLRNSLPPHNADLYRKVRGLRVVIRLSHVFQ